MDMDAPSPHPMIKDVVAPSPKKAANAAPKKSKRGSKKKSSLKPKAKGGRKRKERSGKDEKTEKEQVHKEKKRRKEKKSRTKKRGRKESGEASDRDESGDEQSEAEDSDDEFAREQGIKKGAITPRAPAPKRAVKPAKIVDELPHIIAQREQGSISMCWYRIHCVGREQSCGSCSSRDNRTTSGCARLQGPNHGGSAAKGARRGIGAVSRTGQDAAESLHRANGNQRRRQTAGLSPRRLW